MSEELYPGLKDSDPLDALDYIGEFIELADEWRLEQSDNTPIRAQQYLQKVIRPVIENTRSTPADMPTLFTLGKHILSHGGESDFKIECDALSDADWECAAYLLSKRLPPFGAVEGVPTGGLKMAKAMEKYVTEGPLLVVDDVYTTGNSMAKRINSRFVTGAVLFARKQPPSWITPLFLITEEKL